MAVVDIFLLIAGVILFVNLWFLFRKAIWLRDMFQ